ncbi:urease accessory protein UreE [Phenylobacterium sp.]|uniref:urease accessory protein UreE n=1 Tax=Phenylobacterium sp. TaxID=1871053 RepID=UPI002F3F6D5F
MLRATGILRAHTDGATARPVATAVLQHDERHLRRKVIRLADGGTVLVDLAEPVMLTAGDALLLDGGGVVAIEAAVEELCEVRARDPVHLAELAWHIGNRHLAAEISAHRILILRDHVIRAMLEGLGAQVLDVTETFRPVRGAYSGHGPSADPDHGRAAADHRHDHHDHDHHHHHGTGHQP